MTFIVQFSFYVINPKIVLFCLEQCISSKLNDPSKMPITHISVGRRSTDASRRASKYDIFVTDFFLTFCNLVDDYDEPRYMALNSYDNCKNNMNFTSFVFLTDVLILFLSITCI
jgi:hypothetical protein